MLTLTKKTEYGLMALIQLSQDGQRFHSARELSDMCHIPLPLLMNILKTLAQHHIVSSTRGARGGYKLATPADRLSLSRIVQVLEGPLKLVQCVGDNGEEVGLENRCERTGCCSIRSPLLKINDRLERFLGKITLAGLAESATSEVEVTLRVSANSAPRPAAADETTNSPRPRRPIIQPT